LRIIAKELHNSAYWRELAAQIRTRAEEVQDAVAVAPLFEVARLYEETADALAEREARHKPAAYQSGIGPNEANSP
jgi:hypothetical protein